MAERHLTPQELAKRIGTSYPNAHRLLAGERSIRIGIALRICRGLKITASRLLEENPPAHYWDNGVIPEEWKTPHW